MHTDLPVPGKGSGRISPDPPVSHVNPELPRVTWGRPPWGRPPRALLVCCLSRTETNAVLVPISPGMFILNIAALELAHSELSEPAGLTSLPKT